MSDDKDLKLSPQNQILLSYIKKSFDQDTSHKILQIILPEFWSYETNPEEFKQALRITRRGDEYISRAAHNYLHLMIQTKKIDKIINDAVKELKH